MKKILCYSIFQIAIFLMMAQQSFEDNAGIAGVSHIYGSGAPGGGVSFVDFNRDGWDDLTLGTAIGEKINFYVNNQGSFTEIDPGINYFGEAKQVLWVDFDNDGDYDFYVAGFDASNRLYENLGNLVFSDITAQAQLPVTEKRHFGAIFGDYDRDGLLDLYFTERRLPIESVDNLNRLFRNNGDKTFTEVTNLSGTSDAGKLPFCASFIDFNNDQWPDIYIANDKDNGNTLFMNQKDGTFTDISVESGSGLEMSAMSVTPGDFDRNGYQDIYISNIQQGNKLLKNNGPVSPEQPFDISFDEVSDILGVSFFGIGWGCQFLDGDNDGDEDLYVSGMLIGSDVISSHFYLNDEGVGFMLNEGGFEGDTIESYSNATGDYNNDGNTDIIVVNGSPFASQLWRNNNVQNHWIKIHLQGVLSNRDGIGSKIIVYTSENVQYKFTTCGSGFLGQNSRNIHFGTGLKEEIDSIEVHWPTGHIDRFYEVQTDQILPVVEGSTTGGEIYVDPEVTLSTSIENVETKAIVPDISIHPNPAGAFLSINSTTDFGETTQYSILNCLGIPLINGTIKQPQEIVHIGNLLPGIYFISKKSRSGGIYLIPFIKI